MPDSRCWRGKSRRQPANAPGPSVMSSQDLSTAPGCVVLPKSTDACSWDDRRPNCQPRPERSRVTDTSERLSLDDVALRASRILDEVERAVIDKRPALELAL